MEEIGQMVPQQDSTYNNFPMFIDLKTILSDQTNFRCLKNNIAQIVCSDPNCQKPGLCCGQRKCQCQTNHRTCKNIFLWRVTESILQRPQNIPQKVKESYKALINNINKIIEQISDLRANFESQLQYFGLLKNELKFIEFVRDNKMNQISGKLINLLQSNLETQIHFDMLSKDQINNQFQKTKKQFSKLCKQIQSNYSKKQKKGIRYEFDQLFQDSQILTNQQQRQLLSTWIKQIPYDQNFTKIETKILFRASQHQFKAQQFRKCCEGKQNTITIIKNEFDKILGAYTYPKRDYKLQSDENYIADEKNKSFLFSLDEKIRIKCKQPQYCLRCNQIGPNFGQGDLFIYDNANNVQNGFNPFNKYNITDVDQKYQNSQQTYLLLNGNTTHYFKVKQYEVYQIVENQKK